MAKEPVEQQWPVPLVWNKVHPDWRWSINNWWPSTVTGLLLSTFPSPPFPDLACRLHLYAGPLLPQAAYAYSRIISTWTERAWSQHGLNISNAWIERGVDIITDGRLVYRLYRIAPAVALALPQMDRVEAMKFLGDYGLTPGTGASSDGVISGIPEQTGEHGGAS